MRIVRSKDYDLIDSILNIPEILDAISSKKLKEPFKTPRNDNVYYLLPIEDEVLGVFIVHKDSPCSYKVHANIPVKHRKRYAEEACIKTLEWIWDNIDTNKINAHIPTIFPNVISRAKKCGFEVEGIIKRHYLRDGKELDVAFMGLERG